MRKRKKIRLPVLLLFVFLIIIDINLLQSILTFWSRRDILTREDLRLSELKNAKRELEKQLFYAQSPEYVEKIAREELGLARPGDIEVMVILPTPSLTPTATPVLPVWKQWLNKFR